MIEELKKKQNALQCEANRLQKLISDIEACNNVLEKMNVFVRHSGAMYFVGEDKGIEIFRVKLNEIAGCVEVPQLIQRLALKYKEECLRRAEPLA